MVLPALTPFAEIALLLAPVAAIGLAGTAYPFETKG